MFCLNPKSFRRTGGKAKRDGTQNGKGKERTRGKDSIRKRDSRMCKIDSNYRYRVRRSRF